MPNNESVSLNDRPRVPWNKGKLIGPKPPLRPKHVDQNPTDGRGPGP